MITNLRVDNRLKLYCEDARLGVCYQRRSRGECEAGGRVPVKMADCCCTLGLGWGENCTPCPRRGSAEYRSEQQGEQSCSLNFDLNTFGNIH